MWESEYITGKTFDQYEMAIDEQIHSSFCSVKQS